MENIIVRYAKNSDYDILFHITDGISDILTEEEIKKSNEEKLLEVCEVKKTFDWRNYLPQFVLITIALVIGVYIPPFINNLINGTIIGF